MHCLLIWKSTDVNFYQVQLKCQVGENWKKKLKPKKKMTVKVIAKTQ